MSLPRVLLAFGTRPEAIKMLPVARALRAKGACTPIIAVTGQHRQMLDQVFTAFGERADIDLSIMTHGQSLPELTSRILLGMTEVLGTTRPDLVLVHGDTTTAMAAALAAFYARVRVGHVEAGLRSFDLARPWPEEFNRVTIDSLCDFLFAPTRVAAQNLSGEYNRRAQIHVTGNTGIDALLHVSRMLSDVPELASAALAPLLELNPDYPMILVTGHRRESFGKGFERICSALSCIAENHDVHIVYPVHLNPQVDGVVRSRLGTLSNIHLVEPVDYLDMVRLMKRSKIILTDSGGVQEEGPALGKPVLVMRETTERPEALETGVVTLVGTDPDLIFTQVSELLENEEYYRSRSKPVFPYGDGTAAQKIADILAEVTLR